VQEEEAAHRHGRGQPRGTERVESSGIIFLDEMTRLPAAKAPRSRCLARGVQADHPSHVKHNGQHALWHGAHDQFCSSPRRIPRLQASDLIPELQGRFPIRVELQSLTVDDFLRILTSQGLAHQAIRGLLETEGVRLEFAPMPCARWPSLLSR